MIAIDTSAVVAIVLGEPERHRFLEVIRASGAALISTVSVVEARMVVHGRRGPRAVALMDDWLRLPPLQVTPATLSDMDAATAAFVVYGKGSGHPAALNFGDVFSYALAKVRGIPLLFTGDDVAKTDIRSALEA